MSLPTKIQAWILDAPSPNDFSNLQLHRDLSLPELDPEDVLIEIRAVALNYRDLAISRGNYPLPASFPLVPTSDAAGLILSTGSRVQTFFPSLTTGAHVCILPAPLFHSGHLTTATTGACGDGFKPGLLQKHIILPASWVSPCPTHLSSIEACTLGTAGLTAWNALFDSGSAASGSAGGRGPRAVGKGDWVVTQGTGAVSLFAAKFAKKVGANVIATTGRKEKEAVLRGLGVDHVLNYPEDEKWGETAMEIVERAGGDGVDLVVDVGGAGTLGQSLAAIRYDGMIAVVGFLSGGGVDSGPSSMEILPKAANVRGVLAESKVMFEEMVKALEGWEFKAMVDEKIWSFGEARDSFEYLWEQKHTGKVVTEVSD